MVAQNPLRIAWISDFPVEWLDEVPNSVQTLPRQHPATWQMILLGELENNPALQLHIIVLKKGIEKSFSFLRRGVTFHIVKYWSGARGPTFFWGDTILIRRVLRQIGPDVVHAWGSERGASIVATRLPYPHLVTMQGLFLWFHKVIRMSQSDRFSLWAERVGLPKSKNVSAESKAVVEFLRRSYPGVSVTRIEHSPNGMFYEVKRTPKTNPIEFVSCGTIGYRKGSDLLLKALDQLVGEVDFRAVLIGHPDETFLEPLRKSLSPELWRRLEFRHGLHPQRDMPRALETPTISVLPTRTDTGPVAVKESVVAGVPVIGSDVGGIPEYVFPGENGFIFQSGDLAGLTNALRQACRHELFRLGMVDAKALARVRELLSPKRMAEGFLRAYQEIAQIRG